MADLFIDFKKRVLLEDWSRASPLDESKLWLLRREDIVGKEEGPWEDGLTGEARHGILGTLGMLGARIRLGMLLRSLSMQSISTNQIWYCRCRLTHISNIKGII